MSAFVRLRPCSLIFFVNMATIVAFVHLFKFLDWLLYLVHPPSYTFDIEIIGETETVPPINVASVKIKNSKILFVLVK